MPWLSLASGVAGAFWMERTASRAGLVLLAASATWILLALTLLVSALPAERFPEKMRAWIKPLRASMAMFAQGTMQLCLFFVVPFFAYAADVESIHLSFLLALFAVGLVLIWDPFYYRAITQPSLATLLCAFVGFATLDCVLPMLGLSNRTSLLVSGAVAIAGTPILMVASRTQGTRLRSALRGFTLALAGATALWLAAPCIPPAPLRLTSAALGTTIEDRELLDPTRDFDHVPEQLVCATAIAAPRGLHDELVHVWHRDGARVDAIPLTVTGGRERGYRTWSSKKNIGPGMWRCRVETRLGQSLGSAEARIGR